MGAKKDKKVYIALYIVINVSVLLGIVEPFLISAKSSLLVILGIVLFIVDAFHIQKLIKKII